MAETRPWSNKVFGALGVLAFIAVVAAPIAYRLGIGPDLSHTSGEWNNFGTFFGGLLGPILSMLAFFALVYTIFLQEQQLSLARATLKAADEDKELTRKQLDAAVDTQHRTAEALALQNKLAGDHAVKTMFFELVTLHNQIVRDISYTVMTLETVFRPNSDIPSDVPVPEILEGRRALEYLFNTAFREFYREAAQANAQRVPGGLRTVREFDYVTFEHFYGRILYPFGQYFRNLYRIFKFIDESQLDPPDKSTLAGLIKAQMSNAELGLTFYNGKSQLGIKFKPLLEKYKMFENMMIGTLLDAESARDYDVAAYGESADRFFAYVGIPQPDKPEGS